MAKKRLGTIAVAAVAGIGLLLIPNAVGAKSKLPRPPPAAAPKNPGNNNAFSPNVFVLPNLGGAPGTPGSGGCGGNGAGGSGGAPARPASVAQVAQALVLRGPAVSRLLTRGSARPVGRRPCVRRAALPRMSARPASAGRLRREPSWSSRNRGCGTTSTSSSATAG